jgi:hypothetical protein
MVSYNIWVPSKQKYIRMFEFNCEQYRSILKVIDDDPEFDFLLKQTLMSLLYDKTLSIEDFTILDLFVIFLQLKIRSCGSSLKLTSVCSKCETQTKVNIDLNNLIERLAVHIDRSFEKPFTANNMTVVCDVPYVNLREENLSTVSDLNKNIDHYLFSFIKTLIIGDKIIDIKNLKFDEKILICQNLPFNLLNEIKDNYIEQIHEIVSNLFILDVKCKNETCGTPLNLNLDISNINDVIRVLFRDTSSLNMIMDYASVSSNIHLGFDFFKNVSPVELSLIKKSVEESLKEENAPPSNESIDLFEKYRLETAGMVETPSEFR